MNENKLTMVELFSGIGAQERALRELKIPYEVVNTCDCDKDAMLSYAAMRFDLESEMNNFDFPDKDEMICELQSKNIGYDFEESKHTITNKTNLEKVKQYYIAYKLSKNLGDISKVEKLPYVDLVFHSSPCQDYSAAGKNAGGDEGSETRSSLMYESLRLIKTSMPKYVIWENVKNVLSDKHKHNFDNMLNTLSDLGYNNYWKVLNSKNFGIPQNRERVFAISIRKDIDTKSFRFPQKIELDKKLKDLLETNVSKNFYLSDKILSYALDINESQKETAWSDRCNNGKVNPEIAFAIGCRSAGGNQRAGVSNFVIPNTPQEFTVKQLKQLLFPESNPYNTSNQTSNNNGVKVVGDGYVVKKYNEFIEQNGYVPEMFSPYDCFEVEDTAPTLTTNCGSPTSCNGVLVNDTSAIMKTNGTTTGLVEPFIVASRGRNPDNPSDRTVGSPTEQMLEPNFSGCSNTLTSVQKDNYVAEPQVLKSERTQYGKEIRKQYENGEIQEKIGNMNEMVPRDDDISNTITTVAKDNYLVEPDTKFVCGIGEKDRVGDGKQLSRNYPQGSRVYDSDGIATTLTSQGVGSFGGFSGLYKTDEQSLRIRKLTPKECWRLMGFSDDDQENSAKFVSQSAQYKQAGNSIVTNCLTALFSSLLLKDGWRYTEWSKHTVSPIANPKLDKTEKVLENTKLF